MPTATGSAILFELRGAKPGTAHAIPEAGLRIGSGEGNDLIVQDRDVAERQVEIVLQGQRSRLTNLDLGGTSYLNGQPFEQAELRKGDILTLGDSMFRFVLPGEAVSQHELWEAVGGRQGALEGGKGRSRRFSLLLTASLAAVVAVVVVVLTNTRQEEGGSQQTKGRLAELGASADRRELRQIYERGKDLMSARRWDEALLAFDQVMAKSPSFMETGTYYKEAKREGEHLDLLNAGKGLFLEGQLDEAKATLRQVPKDSVYFREAERLAREMDSRMLRERLRTAEAALAKQDWATAKQEAEAVLERYPNNTDAHAILERARLLQRQVADRRPLYGAAWAPRQPERPSGAARGKGPGGERQIAGARSTAGVAGGGGTRSSTGSKASPLQTAVTAYVRGDAAGSLQRLERLEGKNGGKSKQTVEKVARLAEDVRVAETLYHQAATLQEQGRRADALGLWEKFLERDRRIAGEKRSRYFEQASGHLVRLYYERGRKEFDRGNAVGAYRFWKMAKTIYPEDSDLQKGLTQLDELARRFYREGYSLQEINLPRAIEKWQEVLRITPPDNPYHQKSKKRIALYSKAP